MPGTPDAIIVEARKRWQKCADAETDQRRRILLAKKFRAGDQWPEPIKRVREGAQAIGGIPAQPARPCLVVDRLSQPVRQTSNTIKNASFGFDVLPNGAGADTDTAEIYKGYMRRVHNNARGESPVEWAADNAIEGGIGWFRLRTDYVHTTWDGDPNDPEVFDQELKEERITNNLAVYCDPASMLPTRRDAQFMFIVEDLDKDEFKTRYPKADLRGLDEFMSTGDMVGWVSTDTIRIAEYWRITYTHRTFCKLQDGSIVEKTKDSPKYSKDQIVAERVMRVPHVKGSKINAVEVLTRADGSQDEWDWTGLRIPIFPILGEELNVDGKPHLRGIIEPGMDPQRMVNYTYSGAVEIFALAPKVPWVAAAGQIEPYKAYWDTANQVNYSHLVYDPVSIGGELVPPPQRQAVQADIGAAVELMRTSEEAIKATTSTGDASLGNSHPNERSGRALQALQAASDLSNSNYPDNVRRALIDCADEMAVVIPRITRPGQILEILGEDEEPKQVMIGKPFKPGPNGLPEAAPDDITPEIARMKESLYQFYDLNQGRYAVTVSVGKANATKREEGAAALGELIPHLPPEMAAVAMPDYVEQLSFPGAHKIAEKLRKALPPHLQEQPEGGAPPLPPQVQAMLQQLQQENAQLKQFVQTEQAKQQGQLQAAQLDAQTKTQTTQAELHAKLQLAQLDAQTKMQVAEMQSNLDADRELALQVMKNAATIAVAHINAASKGASLQMHAQEEAQALGHQAEQAEADRQQEAALTDGERAHQAEMAERSHQQGLEAQAQALALQPPTEAP